MRNLMLITAGAILLGTSLSAAAGGSIQLKDGKTQKAHDIQAETVSGIIWEQEKDRPGTRIQLWDVDTVNYQGQDDVSGLPRKLAAGSGPRLAATAEGVINAKAPAGYDAAQWARIQLSAQYYLAMASWLNQDWKGAVSGLEQYIKDCEKPENLYDKSVALRVKFSSKVSGKAVENGGGLNRYYLDALEMLGLAYIKSGDAKSANEKAFQPLIALCDALSISTGNKQYFAWAMRGLRVSAANAEKLKDYAGARELYVTLRLVAIKQGGEESRPAYEAKLKIGFMQILEGDSRNAQASFSEAVKNWKADHKEDRFSPPASGWLNPDKAYLTAGCFLGQGLVIAAGAKDAKEWGEALESFSTSLAIFNADDEIRSKALLGAANAAAKLAELNKDNKIEVKKGDKTVQQAVASANYALLADKYLGELTMMLPKSLAAEDASIPGIRKVIEAYKG